MGIAQQLEEAVTDDEVEEVTEVGGGWRVVKTSRTTRATRRTSRLGGGSPSEGKGSRTVWKIDGPWDLGNSYHNGIRSVSFRRKGEALDQARRLAAGAK
jgi:hypothetical protein